MVGLSNMALIMTRAARLKSEVRLAEAVSLFEASLPDDQKKTYRIYKSQTQATLPDTSSVMQLTSEIDRTQRNRTRYLGPRFTNFLHGVQQYVALGDVIIGGSQNIIACGIWSLVRMSLLVRPVLLTDWLSPCRKPTVFCIPCLAIIKITPLIFQGQKGCNAKVLR